MTDYHVSIDCGETWHPVNCEQLQAMVDNVDHPDCWISIDGSPMCHISLGAYRVMLNAPPLTKDEWDRPTTLYGIPIVYE